MSFNLISYVVASEFDSLKYEEYHGIKILDIEIAMYYNY